MNHNCYSSGIQPNDMVRILWGSEQPTRPTGYGIVTRNLIKRLVAKGHEVFVMGWDYNGEDFLHPEGWTMVHAGISGYGSENLGGPNSPTVLEATIKKLDIDIYISLIDPWYIGHSVMSTNKMSIPYIAYLPIDGFPISPAWKDILKMVHTPMWMSKFGKRTFNEFVKNYSSGGTVPVENRDGILDRYLTEDTPVLYHGVELDIFKPITDEEKAELKKKMGIKWDFVYMSVARNTNRKQIPRLLEAFSLFLVTQNYPKDVGLVLHCGDPSDTFGMGGWNLPALIAQYNLGKYVAFSDTSSNPLSGLTTEEMARLFQCCDVHVMATGGEGFGIPSAEAMACGKPIILPDNSTGPELVGVGPQRRGWIVESATHITGPQWGVNMSLVNIEELAWKMQTAYEQDEERKEFGENARKFAEKNFNWDVLTDQLEKQILETAIKLHPLGGMSRVI